VCNVVLLCHAGIITNSRNRSLCLVYPLSSSVLLTEQGHHTSHLQDPSITKHCKPVPKHRQPITQTIPHHSRHTNPQTSGVAQYTCTNERIEKNSFLLLMHAVHIEVWSIPNFYVVSVHHHPPPLPLLLINLALSTHRHTLSVPLSTSLPSQPSTTYSIFIFSNCPILASQFLASNSAVLNFSLSCSLTASLTLASHSSSIIFF
jgi:hypothetical protein